MERLLASAGRDAHWTKEYLSTANRNWLLGEATKLSVVTQQEIYASTDNDNIVVKRYLQVCWSCF